MAKQLQRGMIPITLDGKERLIFFDMAATWLIVQKYGADFARALYSVRTTPVPGAKPKVEIIPESPDALAYFLWAGLSHELKEGETLTVEEVAAMIGPWNFSLAFHMVVFGLSGAVRTPELKDPAGKGSATATPDARRGKPAGRASTSTKRKGSSAVH